MVSRHSAASAALALCILLCRVPPAARAGTDDPVLSSPPVRLLAAGVVAHNALDKEGETLGGFGSALACDGPAEGRYLSVSDRGPGDGGIDYRPRLQAWRIERAPDDASRLRAVLESTTILTDAEGNPCTGLVPDAPVSVSAPLPRRKDGRLCLDPEGIVCAPDGTIYLSDEYGPFVYQFTRAGRLCRVLRPPGNYLPKAAGGGIDFGANEEPASGRTPNRGFEGLAISPDGRTLTALLQSALAQDGGKEGGLTRLLAFDMASGQPVAEYAYAMEDAREASQRLGLEKGSHLKTKSLSVCELHTVDAERFLVIERDNRGLDGTDAPEPAADKSVWLIDLAGATNLLAAPTHGDTPLAEAVASGQVKPVGKRLLVDIVRACRESGHPVFTAGIPEKWEGLALRPAAGGAGQHTLLMSTDNDFLSPVLHLAGREGGVPFPKARRPLDSVFALFEVTIPDR